MGYFFLTIIVAAVAFYLFTKKGKKPGQTVQGGSADRGVPAPAIEVTVSQPKTTYQDGGPDAWEGWDYMGTQVATNGKELVKRLQIQFTDKDGQATKRDIDTKRFVSDGKDGVIYAYCRLRESNRPFRLSRVTQAVDLETGESLTNLPQWLLSEYGQSPRGMADDFITEHMDALAALFYVAKADGAYRQAERNLLSEFCESVGLSKPEVGEVVGQDVGGWTALSAIGYGKALRAVASRPDDYRRKVLDTARAMVESDKTQKDSEANALTRMMKELSPKGL